MAEQKTNVMRVLEQKKIPYTAHAYPHGDEAVDGVTVARLTGLDPDHRRQRREDRRAGGACAQCAYSDHPR